MQLDRLFRVIGEAAFEHARRSGAGKVPMSFEFFFKIIMIYLHATISGYLLAQLPGKTMTLIKIESILAGKTSRLNPFFKFRQTINNIGAEFLKLINNNTRDLFALYREILVPRPIIIANGIYDIDNPLMTGNAWRFILFKVFHK